MTQRFRILVVCAYGFVLLGMGTSSFGVVWPSLADEFGRSTGELGYVTLAYGAGYTVASLLSGRMAARLSIGSLLMWAALTAAGALTVLAAAPAWILFLLATLVLGAVGGQIDAATNTYVAVRHGSRAMGFLHGAFGIGAFLGPLLVTMLLYLGLTWRIAFAVLAIGQAAYAIGLRAFARSLEVSADPEPARTAPGRSQTLGWSVALFFLYAGVASGLGTWTFTYLTEARGFSDTAGGLIVTAYSIGFTASRLLMGAAGNRVDPARLSRWAAIATVVGVGAFWWSPTMGTGVVALVFAGFAHGPIFPLQMLLTAQRFGPSLAATVVGYEIAAANVGFAIVPGLVGLFVDRYGLATVPPVLLAVALLVWVALERLDSSVSPAVAS